MDDNTLTLLTVIAIVALPVLYLGYYFIVHSIDPIVVSNSERIKAIEALNKECSFYLGQSTFYLTKKYDNKSSFTRIEPESLFAYAMREKIDYFTNLVKLIKRNISIKKEYDSRVEKIREMDKMALPDGCHVPLFFMRMREDRLLRKYVQDPPVSLMYYVEMRYRSPKGKVQLEKSRTFFIHDIETSLASVARSTLSADVRRQLSTVERGNLSDSLRYDILRRDGFKCVICGAHQSQGVRLHVDHIMPVSRGGKSTPNNLRTLCERCNIGKSAKIENLVEMTPQNPSVADLVCPKCGNRLIKRNGKYGAFWGCTSYPQCRYTQNIDDKR